MTFKIMFMVGWKDKKLLVYSQASVTKIPDCPTRILPPILSKMPPTEMVGSQLPTIKISVSMEVVVVFPCVPAILTAVL